MRLSQSVNRRTVGWLAGLVVSAVLLSLAAPTTAAVSDGERTSKPVPLVEAPSWPRALESLPPYTGEVAVPRDLRDRPINRYRFATLLRCAVDEHLYHLKLAMEGKPRPNTLPREEPPVHHWSRERVACWMYQRIHDESGVAVMHSVVSGAAQAKLPRRSPFADLPVAHAAFGDVAELERRGIVMGTEYGKYDGDAPVKLGDLVLAIDRAVRRVHPAGTESWSEDARHFLTLAGVPLEVPRDQTGRPVTRYRFARMLELQLRDAQRKIVADYEVQSKRFLAEPDYWWVAPEHTKSPAAMCRWLATGVSAFVDAPAMGRRSCYPAVTTPARDLPLRERIGMDVPNCHPDRAAVIHLTERGIFTFYPDCSFRGDRPLTVDEYAVVIVRMSQDHMRQNSCPPVLKKPIFPTPQISPSP